MLYDGMFFLDPEGDSSFQTRLGLFDHVSQNLPPGVDPRTNDEIATYEGSDALVFLGEVLLPEVYGGEVPDDATMAQRFASLVPTVLEAVAGRLPSHHLVEVLQTLGCTAAPIDEQIAGGGHPPLF